MNNVFSSIVASAGWTAGRGARLRAAALRFVCCASVALLCGMGGLAPGAQPLERFAFERPQMGTRVHVVLYAPDSLLARRAAEAAFARIDTLNEHLSDYLAGSELNRLSATAGTGRDVPVGDDLWTVLVAAQHLAEATGGAFDVTVGPLTRRWRHAMRRNELPPADDLEAARRAVGYRHVRLDAAARTARLAQPGMRLDLGGIAKGYAADEALAALRAFGVTRALVDAGGDVALGEPPPDARGWRVEISTLDADGALVQEARLLARCGVATSGDTYRYVEVDGVRYSHLLDPRTGLGLTDRSLVTVVAPTGMQADALASAVSVLGPDAGLAFVAGMPGVAARVILRTGDVHRSFQSPTFASSLLPAEDD